MNAIDFFESDVAQLPLSRTGVERFEDFVAAKLGAYVTFIKKLDPSDDITMAIKDEYKTIKKLCGLIELAITEYHAGLPHKAFNLLNDGIETVWHRLEHLILDDVQKHPQLNELYRIRVAGADTWHYKKADLFHIPFEERHKVTRQRYSIPGLPCLYLEGTLYVCWEEMNRPNFDSVFMARFRVADGHKVRILDLGTSAVLP